MAAMDLEYWITLIPQADSKTCWRSAVAMILYKPPWRVGPGSARIHPRGGITATDENLTKFALSNGLSIELPKPWTLSDLYKLLTDFGPLVLVGAVPLMHAYVLAGLRGDGTDAGTTMIIFDPARDRGRIDRTFKEHMEQYPWTEIEHIIHRRSIGAWG